MFICKFCQKECKNDNSLRNHERCCPLNATRVYKNGMTGKKGSNQYVFAKQEGTVMPVPWNKGLPGIFAGKTHSDATKKILSQKASTNNKGGRCKWFEVAGQKCQGTWERNVALKLEELGIAWTKLKTNKDILEYEMDGKTRSYTPDFYLPAYDVYLEIKGHWWGNDKEKMRIVMQVHTDKKIVIMEKAQYEKFLGGELVW